jgi:DNA-binding NtrC family response regulator
VASGGTTILVVDDDDSVRVTLGAVLSDAGHSVSLSATGSEALARLRRREFDVVLADLHLDDMDGLRILQQVRRRWPETVSLILTGYASVDSAIEALRAGAYDYLCKPCPADELLLTVQRATDHRRMRIQMQQQVRDLETAIETARQLHSALSARLVAIGALADVAIGRVHARGEADQELAAYLEQIRCQARTPPATSST